MDFDKRNKIINLYLTYKSILNKNDLLELDLYFLEDLSLQEISEITKKSREAIRQKINKNVKLIEFYEQELKLYELKQKGEKHGIW